MSMQRIVRIITANAAVLISQSVCTEHVMNWFWFTMWLIIGFIIGQIVLLVSNHCDQSRAWLSHYFFFSSSSSSFSSSPFPSTFHILSFQIAMLPMTALLKRMKLNKKNTQSWSPNTDENLEEYEDSYSNRRSQSSESVFPSAPPRPPQQHYSDNQRSSVISNDDMSNRIVCPHCHYSSV